MYIRDHPAPPGQHRGSSLGLLTAMALAMVLQAAGGQNYTKQLTIPNLHRSLQPRPWGSTGPSLSTPCCSAFLSQETDNFYLRKWVRIGEKTHRCWHLDIPVRHTYPLPSPPHRATRPQTPLHPEPGKTLSRASQIWMEIQVAPDIRKKSEIRADRDEKSTRWTRPGREEKMAPGRLAPIDQEPDAGKINI